MMPAWPRPASENERQGADLPRQEFAGALAAATGISS